MVNVLAGSIVAIFGLFLIGLAVAIVVKPGRVEQFLNAFASSARHHFIEQAVRLIVGTSLVLSAPFSCFTTSFRYFGWIIIGTTICLLVIPWRWHNRFASWVVPVAIRYLKLYGVLALALGGFILYAVACGLGIL